MLLWVVLIRIVQTFSKNPFIMLIVDADLVLEKYSHASERAVIHVLFGSGVARPLERP